MTNTAGAIPGIIGVVVTGAILDQTGSWPLALFVPSIFFFVTGTFPPPTYSMLPPPISVGQFLEDHCSGVLRRRPRQTGSWPLALFAPSVFFFVTGAFSVSTFTFYNVCALDVLLRHRCGACFDSSTCQS